MLIVSFLTDSLNIGFCFNVDFYAPHRTKQSSLAFFPYFTTCQADKPDICPEKHPKQRLFNKTVQSGPKNPTNTPGSIQEVTNSPSEPRSFSQIIKHRPITQVNLWCTHLELSLHLLHAAIYITREEDPDSPYLRSPKLVRSWALFAPTPQHRW